MKTLKECYFDDYFARVDRGELPGIDDDAGDDVGYFTVEKNGKIELYVCAGDGINLLQGIFSNMDEVNKFIEENDE